MNKEEVHHGLKLSLMPVTLDQKLTEALKAAEMVILRKQNP